MVSTLSGQIHEGPLRANPKGQERLPDNDAKLWE